MDALIAKGNSVAPLKRKRSTRTIGQNGSGPSSSRTPNDPRQNSDSPSGGSKTKSKASSGKKPLAEEDPTLFSISSSARTASTGPASKAPSNRHVKDLKLRAHLNSLDAHAKEARELAKDAGELLLSATAADAGFMAADDVMERTWRVKQGDIVKSVGEAVASQRKEWVLDGGPYRCRYTRNGRYVCIVSAR